jgi:hypothetical protein
VGAGDAGDVRKGLATHIGRPAPSVSQHLAKLRMARLVRTRREGATIFYSLDNDHIGQLVTDAVLNTEHAGPGVPGHHRDAAEPCTPTPPTPGRTGPAACVWDGPTGALAPFWDAVHVIDPAAEDEALLSGARMGHLTELFEAAGVHDVEEVPIAVEIVHPTFAEWWEPYTYGVGPAGDYVQRLDDDRRAGLESVARERLGSGPFTVTAKAWAARGTVRR